MYYSFAPTKLNEQIHMAAVYQAMFAPILGLCWMLFFSILRLGRCQACPATPASSCPPLLQKPLNNSVRAEKAQEKQGAAPRAWPSSVASLGGKDSC